MSKKSYEETAPLPADLRLLKGLVTLLTIAMIVGVITIATVMVMRLNQVGSQIFVDPGDFELPEGVSAISLSVVNDRVLLIGTDEVLRIYDATSHEEQRSFDLQQ